MVAMVMWQLWSEDGDVPWALGRRPDISVFPHFLRCRAALVNGRQAGDDGGAVRHALLEIVFPGGLHHLLCVCSRPNYARRHVVASWQVSGLDTASEEDSASGR
ncbi:hypothetical protein Vafri_15033 [Volvox africanus]|nr:hypothetical protein Vafri_15033 [Volvox africanus]